MTSVFLLFTVHSIVVWVSSPDLNHRTSAVAQERQYVNEYATLEQCRVAGIKALQNRVTRMFRGQEIRVPASHAFHCVPAYSQTAVEKVPQKNETK